jgi:hypothetical protein
MNGATHIETSTDTQRTMTIWAITYMPLEYLPELTTASRGLFLEDPVRR